MFWLSCRMLQGKTNSELLKSIQSQLNKFCHPQMAWKAQRKVNITKGVDWSFQKYSQVSFLLKMMDFCICIPNQFFFKQPFLWEGGKVCAKFDMKSSSRRCCCFYLRNKLWFFIGRAQPIKVYLFYNYRPNPYIESSVLTRITILSP